jgi:hypothetical protein
VYATGDVDTTNDLSIGQQNADAMSILDWFAQIVCSYVVGLTLVGEVKDTELCAIAAERNRKELSRGWQIALALLNRFRSHFFVQNILICVPLVILLRGGGALTVAFNTVAIMFLTEVDNMSYHFFLSEKARERVDRAGHVRLTDAESKKLSRTKVLCTTITVVGVATTIYFRAAFGAAMGGMAMSFFFKASEVISMQGSSPKNTIVHLAKAFGFQILAANAFMIFIFLAQSGALLN